MVAITIAVGQKRRTRRKLKHRFAVRCVSGKALGKVVEDRIVLRLLDEVDGLRSYLRSTVERAHRTPGGGSKKLVSVADAEHGYIMFQGFGNPLLGLHRPFEPFRHH